MAFERHYWKRRAALQFLERASLILLIWIAAQQLGLITALGPARLLGIDEYWLGFEVAVLGGTFFPARGAPIFKLLTLAMAALYAVIVFTPIVKWPIRAWLIPEHTACCHPSSPPDAVVVLSAGSNAKGQIDVSGLERTIDGITEVSDGKPAALVLTSLALTESPEIRLDQERLASLGTSPFAQRRFKLYRIGPVASTLDEAKKTRELAQKEHWKTIKLVTVPIHMRRAMATFKKQGLNIIAHPCAERQYSIPELTLPRDRLRAFHDWVAELTAYVLYSVRGAV